MALRENHLVDAIGHRRTDKRRLQAREATQQQVPVTLKEPKSDLTMEVETLEPKKEYSPMAKLHDTENIWSQLLPLISAGLSLPAALAQLPEPRPTLWWCKMAIRNDPDLDARYRAAMELRADALADEIAAIADEPIPDHLRGADASAFVQRQRMRVDAKKWLACKLFPKRWGDRVELGVDITQRISITAALAKAEQRVVCYENGVVLPADESGRARIGVTVAASEGQT